MLSGTQYVEASGTHLFARMMRRTSEAEATEAALRKLLVFADPDLVLLRQLDSRPGGR